MSGTTGDQGKGIFHSTTGVPFWEFMSGNRTGYLKRKGDITKQLRIKQEEFSEQLKISSDIDYQLAENHQRYVDLSTDGNETQRQIARRLEVEERMRARKDNYLYRNPRNTFDSIVSYIPVVGSIYKWGLVTKDGYDEYNDRQTLSQMKPKEVYEKEMSSTLVELRRTGIDVNKLMEKQIANNNALKNLFAIKTDMAAELDRM
jgi:hypothetical protein